MLAPHLWAFRPPGPPVWKILDLVLTVLDFRARMGHVAYVLDHLYRMESSESPLSATPTGIIETNTFYRYVSLPSLHIIGSIVPLEQLSPHNALLYKSQLECPRKGKPYGSKNDFW